MIKKNRSDSKLWCEAMFEYFKLGTMIFWVLMSNNFTLAALKFVCKYYSILGRILPASMTFTLRSAASLLFLMVCFTNLFNNLSINFTTMEWEDYCFPHVLVQPAPAVEHILIRSVGLVSLFWNETCKNVLAHLKQDKHDETNLAISNIQKRLNLSWFKQLRWWFKQPKWAKLDGHIDIRHILKRDFAWNWHFVL